jgi:hypothetical protein
MKALPQARQQNDRHPLEYQRGSGQSAFDRYLSEAPFNGPSRACVSIESLDYVQAALVTSGHFKLATSGSYNRKVTGHHSLLCTIYVVLSVELRALAFKVHVDAHL